MPNTRQDLMSLSSGEGRTLGVLTGLILVMLSACGTSPGAPAPSTGTSAAVITATPSGAPVNPSPEPSATTAAPSSDATPVVPPAPSTSDPGVPTAVTSALPGLPGGASVSLTGTVTEGVERGCVVLTDDAGTALASLLGFDQQAYPFGSRIAVTGRWATDRVSFCQQGPLLEVQSVSAAG